MSAIRTAVRRGLAAFGLATAGQVAALQASAERDRAALIKAREDARAFKIKAEEFREKASQADALAGRLAKAQRQAERAELYRTELQEARARVERAEKAVAFSREQLMATEMKLDLVEAAISILDRRTRE
jgi:hypothetical protein